jgi:hypothetical protein
VVGHPSGHGSRRSGAGALEEDAKGGLTHPANRVDSSGERAHSTRYEAHRQCPFLVAQDAQPVDGHNQKGERCRGGDLANP